MTKFIPLVLISLIGCGQGKSGDETNISATTFSEKSLYPDQKTIAFKTISNEILNYIPESFKRVFNNFFIKKLIFI